MKGIPPRFMYAATLLDSGMENTTMDSPSITVAASCWFFGVRWFRGAMKPMPRKRRETPAVNPRPVRGVKPANSWKVMPPLTMDQAIQQAWVNGITNTPLKILRARPSWTIHREIIAAQKTITAKRGPRPAEPAVPAAMAPSWMLTTLPCTTDWDPAIADINTKIMAGIRELFRTDRSSRLSILGHPHSAMGKGLIKYNLPKRKARNQNPATSPRKKSMRILPLQ
mmetsp:Transcript_112579/g.257866  ORF Transcript_112579/g.257866 Transcript_112579/m.257866 type:complete len:225 (+) Transcript_112579:394-1068(+)